jgi:hypothetical protein
MFGSIRAHSSQFSQCVSLLDAGMTVQCDFIRRVFHYAVLQISFPFQIGVPRSPGASPPGARRAPSVVSSPLQLQQPVQPMLQAASSASPEGRDAPEPRLDKSMPQLCSTTLFRDMSDFELHVCGGVVAFFVSISSDVVGRRQDTCSNPSLLRSTTGSPIKRGRSCRIWHAAGPNIGPPSIAFTSCLQSHCR